MKVVAEGVEDKSRIDLDGLTCDSFRLLFRRPGPSGRGSPRAV